MNSNTRFEQFTTEALREHKNRLGREQYARRMIHADEKPVAEGSESLRECRNRLAREAHVHRLAKENIDESEQCRNIQRQALAKRTTEQVELRRKKQKEYKNRISNAARIENYNTKTVSLHNIGSISIECPECKALHWIDEKVTGSRHTPIFSTCCAKGKVKLLAIASPPELLEMLLTEE
ncbi:9054_t:CDS:1, partial [Acaulospora morrowiae]